VDRLGDADQLDAALAGEPAQDLEAAVPTDADEGVEAEAAIAADDFVRAVLERAVGHREGEGVALVGGAEDGAAAAQDRAVEQDGIELLGARRIVEQPG